MWKFSQPDNIYPDLQAFFETDVALQSVTDVPVNSRQCVWC